MTAVMLVAAAGIVVWFGRRALVGMRARSIGGVRLRVTAKVVALALNASARRALVGALAGYVIAGRAGAAVGAVAGSVYEPIVARRRHAVRRRQIEEQLPDTLRAVAAAVRAGRSLPQALEAARDEAPHPIRDSLHHAVRRLEVGTPVDDALTVFERRAGVPAAAGAVETIRIARAAGGDLPAVLDIAVESLHERARMERDLRATTAQARLSALVVGAMPVAFFAIVGQSARAQLRLLFGEPVGWMLLGVGIALEAAGALWMRALVKPS